MKRSLIIIITVITGCQLLYSQARLTSNKETHNFGQIQWKKPVTVEYVITNSGDAPLVLTNITISCACAVAEWTQTPIQPGDKGMVSATFDAKALGHFHKSVGIYSNASPNLVYLNFVGEVVREVTDFTNEHSYSIGSILIDKIELDFPDTHRGDKAEINLSIVNLSDRPYEPVLMHLPSYLSMKKDPEILLKGEQGMLTVTLDSDKLPDLGLTQASVYLSRFAGDKIGEGNEIPISAILLPDLGALNAGSLESAPIIQLSETEIDLSGKKKSKVRHDITITNTGKSPLEIATIQVFDPAVNADLKKNLLAPGDKTRLRINVDKDILDQKKRPRILLITNDPVQPKVTLDLIIEK